MGNSHVFFGVEFGIVGKGYPYYQIEGVVCLFMYISSFDIE